MYLVIELKKNKQLHISDQNVSKQIRNVSQKDSPAAAAAFCAAAAARACCSIRCCVSSSSWICGGSAARNSGLISTFATAVPLAVADVAWTLAPAGTGRFLMSMPWTRAKFIIISTQISIHFDDHFFLIYLRTELVRSIVKHFMLHLTIYDKNLKKIDYKRYRTIKSIFFKSISFCVDIFLSHDA